MKLTFTTTELYRGDPTNDVYIIGPSAEDNELRLVKYIAEMTGESRKETARFYKDSFCHWEFEINKPFSKL